MKYQILSLIAFVGAVQAQADVKYVLTLTNAGVMPISPPIIFVRNGETTDTQVGKLASLGFIEVCQTGKAATRAAELRASGDVTSVYQDASPILPGEVRTFEVSVVKPLQQSIQVESMYGKTKDACVSGAVPSHALVALREHVSTEFVTRDSVVLSGAFELPALGDLAEANRACANALTAVACLRALSPTEATVKPVRFFNGYSPTLLTFLEGRYGAQEVQSLILGTTGAVQIAVKLKH